MFALECGTCHAFKHYGTTTNDDGVFVYSKKNMFLKETMSLFTDIALNMQSTIFAYYTIATEQHARAQPPVKFCSRSVFTNAIHAYVRCIKHDTHAWTGLACPVCARKRPEDLVLVCDATFITVNKNLAQPAKVRYIDVVPVVPSQLATNAVIYCPQATTRIPGLVSVDHTQFTMAHTHELRHNFASFTLSDKFSGLSDASYKNLKKALASTDDVRSSVLLGALNGLENERPSSSTASDKKGAPVWVCPPMFRPIIASLTKRYNMSAVLPPRLLGATSPDDDVLLKQLMVHAKTRQLSPNEREAICGVWPALFDCIAAYSNLPTKSNTHGCLPVWLCDLVITAVDVALRVTDPQYKVRVGSVAASSYLC